VSRFVLFVRFLSPVTTCFNVKLLRGSRGVQPHPSRKGCKSVREKIEKEEERVRKRLCERVSSKKVYRVYVVLWFRVWYGGSVCVCFRISKSSTVEGGKNFFFCSYFAPNGQLFVVSRTNLGDFGPQTEEKY